MGFHFPHPVSQTSNSYALPEQGFHQTGAINTTLPPGAVSATSSNAGIPPTTPPTAIVQPMRFLAVSGEQPEVVLTPFGDTPEVPVTFDNFPSLGPPASGAIPGGLVEKVIRAPDRGHTFGSMQGYFGNYGGEPFSNSCSNSTKRKNCSSVNDSLNFPRKKLASEEIMAKKMKQMSLQPSFFGGNPDVKTMQDFQDRMLDMPDYSEDEDDEDDEDKTDVTDRTDVRPQSDKPVNSLRKLEVSDALKEILRATPSDAVLARMLPRPELALVPYQPPPPGDPKDILRLMAGEGTRGTEQGPPPTPVPQPVPAPEADMELDPGLDPGLQALEEEGNNNDVTLGSYVLVGPGGEVLPRPHRPPPPPEDDLMDL